MSRRRLRQHYSSTLRRKGYPYNTYEYNYYHQEDRCSLHTLLHIHVSEITSTGQYYCSFVRQRDRPFAAAQGDILGSSPRPPPPLPF
jgi:hypothetical protein